MSRQRLLVACIALITMGAVAAISSRVALGAPWAALICFMIAAIALFWPEPKAGDVQLLTEVADALGGAKSPDSLGARLRAVLGRYFHNSYVIAVEGASDRPQLRCLHEVLPPTQGAPLPARFASGELAPVARLLEIGETVRAGETDDNETNLTDPRSSQRFWKTYGLSNLWPARDNDDAPIRGLIALGAPSDSSSSISDTTLLTIARLLGSGLALLHERQNLTGHQRALQQSVTQVHQSLSLALDDLENARAKLVEAEKQAMVGRLAAGIVHEVNTPLGTLGSAVDIIERAMSRVREFIESHADEAPTAGDARRAQRAIEAQGEALSVLRRSQARLREVVERIGRFANLDSAEIKSVDLRVCVEDAVALVKAQRASQQIAFTIDSPADELGVTCFPAKLNHAFFNLVENAAAAIEGAGEVTAQISQQRGTKGLPATAQVEIRDNGCGIAREKLPGLLDLAFTTRIGGRVGLRTGLPATRQTFIELGGDLTIESEPAQGTRVVATLPLGRKTL